MEWTDRLVRRLSTAARWTLLAAVLAGLFGMHVLTAEDAGGGHSNLPMTIASGHADMTVSAPSHTEAKPVVMGAMGSLPSVAVVLSADPNPGAGGDHGGMAGCILFLVVGATALILLLLRLRQGQVATGLGRFAGIAVADMRRRGPPGRWPRLALCVIRV